MDDIFAGEVEEAQKEINESQSVESREELPSDLQEDLRNLESLASIDPSVTQTQEYQDLMAKIDAFNSSQASDEEEEESEEEDEESEEEFEEDESEDDDDDEEEEEEEDDIDDPFGVVSKGNKKAKKVKIDFDIPEGMEELLNSKYGVKDASTFFGSVDTWRAQAQAGTEAQSKLESITSEIQDLPPDIRHAIALWTDGEDHTAPFVNGLRLDFGSDFGDQDVESLVEHYHETQYNKLVKSLQSEEITEDEFNDKIDLLAGSTEKLFNQEKKALVDERVKYEKRQEENLKKMKSSALDSVDALSKAYPNFSKAELNKVKSYLVEGKVDSLFYNADGTYTSNAAEVVADALYGKKMRETIEKLAVRRGISKANQEIVDTSPKRRKKTKAAPNEGAGKAIKPVEHLSSVIVNDDPYA